jgi:hypothetical protein
MPSRNAAQMPPQHDYSPMQIDTCCEHGATTNTSILVFLNTFPRNRRGDWTCHHG